MIASIIVDGTLPETKHYFPSNRTDLMIDFPKQGAVYLHSMADGAVFALADQIGQIAQQVAVAKTRNLTIKLGAGLLAEYEMDDDNYPELIELYDNAGQPLPRYLLNVREVEIAIAEALRDASEPPVQEAEYIGGRAA